MLGGISLRLHAHWTLEITPALYFEKSISTNSILSQIMESATGKS